MLNGSVITLGAMHIVGLLYTYLAEGAGNTSGKGAFRAIQSSSARVYTLVFWKA